MAKKNRFPLEMRDGVQVRTLEELRQNFDIEKAIGYFVDGKLITWLEDRYYIAETEIIKEMDAYAPDVKNKLCSALGIELLVDTEIDVEKIEQCKIRLTKLKQYTDDENLWDKVNQVAFDQEDLADLLDENLKEIFLCANEFQVPYAIGNVTYRGIGEVSVFINATGQIDLEKQNISFENIQLLNSNIEAAKQQYQKGLECLRRRKTSFNNDGWWFNWLKDTEEALEHLKKAANWGHLEACWIFLYEFLGFCVDYCRCGIAYLDEKIMKQLQEKCGVTKSLWDKVEELAQNGEVFALTVEGIRHYYGINVEENESLGIELVRKAAEKGCVLAIEEMSRKQSDRKEMLRWLQEGVKHHSVSCAETLGNGYLNGWFECPIDKNKSDEHFRMATDWRKNGELPKISAKYFLSNKDS